MTHGDYLALIEEIRHHMNLYYNENTSEITDEAYDALMVRLRGAEEAHPEWVQPDSPTQVIGGEAKREAGVEITHNVPMLSIQDVFTIGEVTEWADKVRAMHPDAAFCVEQKIDGLSMTVRYENGALTMAETRGDGLTGEDVTANARMIPDVVKKLRTPYAYLELRGEVYMTHDNFEKVNEQQDALGKKIYANPRNFATGTLRQLDPRVVRERGLSFFVFNVQQASEEALTASHREALRTLSEQDGIRVAPSIYCRTNEEIVKAIDFIGESRGALAYDIDGAVVKIDQTAYRADFPAGSKYSAGHIAYKYPPEEKEAVITEIELSVGMTGRINPTAVFTPVRLCGTTVSRATLHNQDFIDKLGIGIGSTVLVYKSGEIIPKIRAVVKEKTPPDVRPYRMPDTCPVCGAKVVRGTSQDAETIRGDETAADLRCTNDDCPAKLERRIINFVGRDAMDIKGFGREYIRALIGEGYLRNIADLYTLYRQRDALVEQGLIGKETNTDKLLQMIEDSKTNEPWRLLAGLAIANVGRTGARTLMRHFKSMDRLMNASVGELTAVEDVGEITAKAIRAYFEDPVHVALIARLKEAGVRMETQPGAGVASGAAGAAFGGAALADRNRTAADGQSQIASADAVGGVDEASNPDEESLFAGRTYVVTGDLRHFKNRDALIDYVEARGGKVAGSVSKKTYALINNDNLSTSGKNKKAKELGIPVITEEELLGL